MLIFSPENGVLSDILFRTPENRPRPSRIIVFHEHLRNSDLRHSGDKPSARRGGRAVEQVAAQSDTWDESGRGISHVIRLHERPFLLSPGRSVSSSQHTRGGENLSLSLCLSLSCSLPAGDTPHPPVVIPSAVMSATWILFSTRSGYKLDGPGPR